MLTCDRSQPHHSDPGEPAGPLDIHEEYRAAKAWTFRDRPVVKLSADRANNLACQLAGLSGILTLLVAETGGGFELGDYIKGGLLTAANKLAMDCLGDLELGSKEAQAQQQRH
jgi:hypothetical protein